MERGQLTSVDDRLLSNGFVSGNQQRNPVQVIVFFHESRLDFFA
jgi:hypothetical protein